MTEAELIDLYSLLRKWRDEKAAQGEGIEPRSIGATRLTVVGRNDYEGRSEHLDGKDEQGSSLSARKQSPAKGQHVT